MRGGDAALLDDFDDVNARLKATVATWQMGLEEGDGASMLCDLDAVHAEVDGWLEGLAGAYLVELYRVRLRRALDRVRSGDADWVLSPRVDSYHSVWFELHEHLIRLAGRTRADEAAAGRAH
jgi:pyruvate,orthophosphate dikinase